MSQTRHERHVSTLVALYAGRELVKDSNGNCVEIPDLYREADLMLLCNSRAGYLRASRSGLRIPMDAAERNILWDVFENAVATAASRAAA